MRLTTREEGKHSALYRKAIRALGEPVKTPPREEIYNAVILRHTPEQPALRREDDRDARTLKLAHFLGHLHWLEKRIAQSLEYHLEACAQGATPYAAKAVAAVLADEYRHVSYTREAVAGLLPARLPPHLLSLHRGGGAPAHPQISRAPPRRPGPPTAPPV